MSVVVHAPPPFFKRGPAPLARLAFYVILSLALLVFDLKYRYLESLRLTLAVALYPLQRAAYAPVDLYRQFNQHFARLDAVEQENEALRRKQLDVANRLLRQQHLELENQRLRALLDMKARQSVGGSLAEILYAARDPFARRIIVDKGSQDNVVAGQAVIDEAGVLGQVTRTYPLQSEVTLLTDKNQAIPVQIVRNGLRAVLFGTADGQLELRYLATNADVQPEDRLVTSGLDGLYLPGLPVAKVVSVDRDKTFTFARIVCEPLAGIEKHGEVLILGMRELPARQSEERAPAEKPASGKRIRRRN